MLALILRVLLIVFGLAATIAPLPAQSEEDCQRASKLHAEQEFIQELFRNLGDQVKAAGGPSIGSDPNSLQSRVREGISNCQANGGGSNACGNYKRIRDAWLTNNAGGSPGAAMITDPQTCKIEVPEGDSYRTVDPATDRPAGGFEQSDWNSKYEHEKFHQANCRRLNGSGSNYEPGGSASPYLRQMRDPRELAKEEGFAHGITGDVLEDYLKNNCFDPDLFVNAEDMTATCGESASSVAKLKSLANKALDWVVNTPNDWLDIPTTGPVTTQPGGETEVGLKGNCHCCDATTKQGKVRVYGGPGQSILVGSDDANMGCAKNNRCAGLHGDPHARTYDGLRFDFQGAGEFVLARGEGFEVQARLEAWSTTSISLQTAVAARVNGDTIGIYLGDPLRLFVQGLETPLDVGGVMRLPGGGSIAHDGDRYRLTSPEGFVLDVHAGARSHLDTSIGLPLHTVSVGLLGNFDGDRANDIVGATGALLTQPVDFESLYKVFGAGWRVTAENSLFDYAEGESVATFHNPLFPPKRIRGADVSGAARRKAEAVCREAGVVGPINLDDCILDVGLTDDPAFAKSAANQPPDTARLELREDTPGAAPSGPPTPATPATADGVSFDAPAEAFASHSVEIGIKGPVQRGYYLAIAPAGSDYVGKVINPYSSHSLVGSDQVLKLIVPIVPGDYEVRYVDLRGKRILLRQPFRSLEPKCQIEAPAFGEAGKPFEVRVTGDVGDHMYIAVVPVNSPNGEYGRSRGTLKQGNEFVSRISKLPAEPGNYEIRCSSNWGNANRLVHGRRPLTIR